MPLDTDHLDRCLAAYLRDESELRPWCIGRTVVYNQGRIVGYFTDPQEAGRWARREFGYENYLIVRVG